MATLISRFFLVLSLFCLSNRIEGKVSTKQTLADIDKKLKLLNKPAVKSIRSEDGDIIDCVDIYKQPAFDHPALKNHVIQMRPSFELSKKISSSTRNESSKPVILQTWQRSGSCPEGTVPIRRIRKQDLLRADSMEQFGRKTPQVFSTLNRTDYKESELDYINNTKLSFGPTENRSTAILVTYGYNYIGAKGALNVWNPGVETPDDYSSAQIWLKGGPGDNFESVETGWMVNPKLYGDKQTRFFAYWTKDAYKKTGCFDLTCSGFVNTSPKIVLGGAMDKISRWGGEQRQITVGIFMDPKTSNWWLQLNEDTVVGYWPASTLMFYLNHSSTMVEWGGEVYSPNVKKAPHTKTAMGSGEFASAGYGYASFIKDVRIIDYSLSLKYPEWVGTWADELYCYNPLNEVKYGVYPTFYFGGPGQNYNCP